MFRTFDFRRTLQAGDASETLFLFGLRKFITVFQKHVEVTHFIEGHDELF